MYRSSTVSTLSVMVICGGLLATVFGVGDVVAMQADRSLGAMGRAPLEVSWSTTGARATGMALCSIRNVSNKDVVAYSLLVPCQSGSGNCRESYDAVLETASPPHDRLRPGESHERSCVSHALAATGRAPLVDYVLFSDGSEWGRDTQKRSLWIRGIIQGQRGTLARLKHVMEKQGIDAVIARLKAAY